MSEPKTTLWWMEFVSPEKPEDEHLGSAIIAAPTAYDAAEIVREGEQYPAGTVYAMELAHWVSPDPRDVGRFLDPEEADALSECLATRRLH